MNTEKIKVKFCEVRCNKVSFDEGYIKEFWHGEPDPVYIDKVEDLLNAIREGMYIDSDVDIYVDEDEWMKEGYYNVSWLSGSHEYGRNPSEYQEERWKKGKCVLWGFDVLINVSRVVETPLTGLKIG